jgi:hypothetical protein
LNLQHHIHHNRMVKLRENCYSIWKSKSIPKWCKIYATFKACDAGFCFLHATRLDNIFIRPGTHEETLTWIPFLRAYGEIAIVKTPNRLQAKLQNREIPGIYLGPAEDHKGDTYTFWNLITKHLFESRSAVLLQQTYDNFHKLD